MSLFPSISGLLIALLISLPVDNVSGRSFEPSIVGGSVAQPGEAKFQVQVRQMYTKVHNYIIYKWETEEQYAFCGGSLLDSMTVITAAHCVKLVGKNYFIKVRYGTHKLDSSSFPDIKVAEIQIHPGYDDVMNDLALLRLSSPVQVSADSYVSIQYDDMPPNSQTSIFGWGIYNVILMQQFQPENLQKGELYTLNDKDCQRMLDSIDEPKFPQGAAEKVICAMNNKETACQGDSGGPMIYDYDGSLAGITSMVQEGCEKNGLNLYTKISYYTDWILLNRDYPNWS